MSKTHEGYLLIADITGYTMYMSESELEHAQEMLATLLSLIVEHTPPPLVISQLEGDAILSYGLCENFFQGQTFIEIIENTYVAFRKAIERMVLNTHCNCNACANISRLDLKFFLHFGKFVIQHIKDHDELVGSDVILIHRLLKNHVHESLGLQAYCLYTDSAIHQLGLEAACEAMKPHTETYQHLEEVKAWVQDMHAVWERKRYASQISIPEDRIAMQTKIEFDAPPELIWDYLNKPDFRNTLNGSDRYEVINPGGGRTTPGSVYQCYHGDTIIPQTVLEWQPFELIVVQQLLPLPTPNTTSLVEYRLVPTKSGTLFIQSVGYPEGPLIGRLMANMMTPRMSKHVNKMIVAFKQQVENQWQADKGSPTVRPLISHETIREAANASFAGQADLV